MTLLISMAAFLFPSQRGEFWEGLCVIGRTKRDFKVTPFVSLCGKKQFGIRLISPVVAIIDVTTDGQRGSGGASRCSGGRDEPPRPQTYTSVGTANRRWVPPSSIKRDAITPEEKNDIVFRKVRGILNKLTPEKFHKLSEELLSVGLDSTQILKGVILLIFEKALDEPKYSSMYAQLCRKLCEEAPNFDPPSNSLPNNNTFRRLLLAKCQDEFENRRKASEAFEKDGPLTSEEEEQRSLAKHKMLGNIKFIGELGKQCLLQEAILHQCIQQLLAKKKKRPLLKDVAEDLECLAQIMKTVGRRLDMDKAKALMDQYFERMQTLADSSELPSRIRFMLQDVLELRQNKWIPRRVMSEHGPRTIQQIREEAARDYGVYVVSQNMPFGILGRNLQIPAMGGKGRGGMDDVFGALPLGVGTLGTGPGVISTDGFHSYSSNMGRPNRNNMNNTTGMMGGGGSPQLFYGSGRNNQSQNRDRDLFPSYQQRQQNQNFTVTSSNRDLPPRFMKKALQQTGNIEEISLRPAQNSMVLKPKVSAGPYKQMSTTATTGGNGANVPNNALVRELSPGSILQNVNNLANPLLQEAPIVIKQSNQDKNKANKQQIPTKEEFMKQMEETLNRLLNHQNIDDIKNIVMDIKMPKKYAADALTFFMLRTLEKSENDRDMVGRLFMEMKKENMLSTSSCMESLKNVFQRMADLEVEIPRVKSHASVFAARAIADELVTLGEVGESLEGGQHYPLFLLCLQQLHKLQGRNWLVQTFNQSKTNLLNMLPEIDRSKERLVDILEDRGLIFLFPLLRIQADLWKQIQTDTSPNSLYRWIKDNVDSSQQAAAGFINALITCMIKFITQETTLVEGVDGTAVPDKALIDKERDLLEKFKPVFQAFLHEQPALQLVALYSLQVHCYNNSFPKGMLLRWFMMFYDLEVVEEEAFLKWKEDVNDEYPGKGKALFQVNQWLTWLEEAEEEEGSDEGDN